MKVWVKFKTNNTLLKKICSERSSRFGRSSIEGLVWTTWLSWRPGSSRRWPITSRESPLSTTQRTRSTKGYLICQRGLRISVSKGNETVAKTVKTPCCPKSTLVQMPVPLVSRIWSICRVLAPTTTTGRSFLLARPTRGLQDTAKVSLRSLAPYVTTLARAHWSTTWARGSHFTPRSSPYSSQPSRQALPWRSKTTSLTKLIQANSQYKSWRWSQTTRTSSVLAKYEATRAPETWVFRRTPTSKTSEVRTEVAWRPSIKTSRVARCLSSRCTKQTTPQLVSLSMSSHSPMRPPPRTGLPRNLRRSTSTSSHMWPYPMPSTIIEISKTAETQLDSTRTTQQMLITTTTTLVNCIQACFQKSRAPGFNDK